MIEILKSYKINKEVNLFPVVKTMKVCISTEIGRISKEDERSIDEVLNLSPAWDHGPYMQ